VVKDLWGLYISSLDIKIPKDEPANVKLESTDPDLSRSTSYEQDGSDEEGNVSDATSRAYRSTAQDLKKFPVLVISPVFCYLAIVTLRLPVTLNDIYSYDNLIHF
jgi:Rrn7/TAF1B, N-terminal cyclin domain